MPNHVPTSEANNAALASSLWPESMPTNKPADCAARSAQEHGNSRLDCHQQANDGRGDQLHGCKFTAARMPGDSEAGNRAGKEHQQWKLVFYRLLLREHQGPARRAVIHAGE